MSPFEKLSGPLRSRTGVYTLPGGQLHMELPGGLFLFNIVNNNTNSHQVCK